MNKNKSIDFDQVRQAAEACRQPMTHFLRDLVAIPSESTREAAVIDRIRQEMEAVGFDTVRTDAMGNIIGAIGQGRHLIAFDAHIDTVGIGNPLLWEHDPYTGHEDDAVIGGRGSSDQKGGLAAMVYAGKLIKELGLAADCSILMVGSVQEEDCDGLCWQYLIQEEQVRPEFVVITEPTSCRIYRGQRGRMEIKVTTQGLSCHGSAPERGDNAIYKMATILLDLQALHGRLADHPFLGKGSLAVSEIFFTSPARCAVADSCWISIDRRLTIGESKETALAEIRGLPSVRAAGAEVTLYGYDRPSYTGLVYPTDCYFPTWLIDEDHPVCQTLDEACRSLFGEAPLPDKWTFSTNAVSIMGRFGIPCIGYGPGHEDQAHAPNEKTWKDELVKAVALYAAVPGLYCAGPAERMPSVTVNRV